MESAFGPRRIDANIPNQGLGFESNRGTFGRAFITIEELLESGREELKRKLLSPATPRQPLTAKGVGRHGGMCCNFVVEPKDGVDDRKFGSSQRTDRE